MVPTRPRVVMKTRSLANLKKLTLFIDWYSLLIPCSSSAYPLLFGMTFSGAAKGITILKNRTNGQSGSNAL